LHAVLQSLQFWNQIIGERAKTFKFRDFTAIKIFCYCIWIENCCWNWSISSWSL